MKKGNQLAIGTAQFGMSYGVCNTMGQVCHDEVMRILDRAKEAGIDTLDTAISYGDSESCLGQVGVQKWKVITKLPALTQDTDNVEEWVVRLVSESLQRLKIPKLYGLLLHRPMQLLEPFGDKFYQSLINLKLLGMVEKIGVSVYGPDELEALWPRYQFDLVQAPFNVIDRRLLLKGWLARFQESGVEVHTRSVFLQGLLLAEPGCLPEKFVRWQFLWEQWHKWLAENKLTPLQACLGFVLSQPNISRVVVGMESLKHLQDILECLGNFNLDVPSVLMSEDQELINPTHWSSL